MGDSYGYTALMIAVQNSNIDCVKVLAKKCNRKDKRDELIEILSAEPHDK